jgi:hypothetical protein
MAFIQYLAHSFNQTVNIVTFSALIVAVCALIIAYTNFKRGNTAIIKLVDLSASGGQSIGVNNQQMYHKLEVKFKNLGIPLRNPSVSVNGFAGGWFDVRLARYKGDERVKQENDSVLEKGMVASYALFSFEMDYTIKRMLSSLIEPDAYRLCISVFSDGFLVRRFSLKGRPWLTRLKHRWNSFSFWFNGQFERVIIYKGRPIHHCPEILPRLKNYRWQFEYFVKSSTAEVTSSAHAPHPESPARSEV